MRRQRLTLMILEINIKYKILSKQFFLILEGGGPSVCLVCHVGNPVPERGVQGPPTPCPPAPAREIAAGGRTGVPAQARLRPVSVSLGVTRRTGTRRGGRESHDRAPAKGG